MLRKEELKIEETLSAKRTTPGTFVFESDLGEAMVRTLYVKRDAYPNGQPKQVKITVEVVK